MILSICHSKKTESIVFLKRSMPHIPWFSCRRKCEAREFLTNEARERCLELFNRMSVYKTLSTRIRFHNYQNATFSVSIRFPSKRIRCKRSMKTELFDNAVFPCTYGQTKTELFRKRWGHTISSNLLRTKLETYSRWRTGAFLVFYTWAYF